MFQGKSLPFIFWVPRRWRQKPIKRQQLSTKQKSVIQDYDYDDDDDDDDDNNNNNDPTMEEPNVF